MRKKWLFLITYYIIILIIPLGNYHVTFLTALAIGFSILFIILYKLIEDEILFYVYNFIAILGLIFSLGNYNPYSPITLGIAYAMLSLIFLHITYSRFLPMFGNVKINTIIYTLLSIVMGYLSIYLFLIYPIGYGFGGIFFLVISIIILIYLIMQSPKSKNSRHPT